MNERGELLVQENARRFASTPDTVEAVRSRSIRAAIAHLVAGHGRQSALDAMYAGLLEVAPLTFRPTQEARRHA